MFIAKKLELSDIKKVLGGEKVYLSKQSYRRLTSVREFIENKVKGQEIIYGVDTGVGALATEVLSSEEARTLQENLLISHAVGYGESAPDDIILITILLRANMLAKGYSGIRPELIIFLLALLNERIIPVVPRYGSVGASGDLAPLAYIALTVTGSKYSRARYRGKEIYGEELRKLLLRVYSKYLQEYKAKGFDVDESILNNSNDVNFLVKLSYKEGLALINGTEFETAVLIYAYLQAVRSLEVAKKAFSLTMEAIRGIKNALDIDALHLLNMPEVVEVTKDILKSLEGSRLIVNSNEEVCLDEILKKCEEGLLLTHDNARLFGVDPQIVANVLSRKLNIKVKIIIDERGYIFVGPKIDPREICVKWSDLGFVQDSYSIRCTPKVYGTVLRGLRFVENIIKEEMNAITDNPLIICNDNDCKVVSAGNFHGQTIALASEVLSLVTSYLAGISERRIFKLLSKFLNKNLPPFLTEKSGLNSGLMITQYLAAALVNKISHLATPTSSFSLPTSADQEDWNSMGMNSAWKAYDAIELLKRILSIEILASSQAIFLRTGGDLTLLGNGTRKFLNDLMSKIKLPIREDLFYSDYLDLIQNFLYVEN